jgi:hypothetical protein
MLSLQRIQAIKQLLPVYHADSSILDGQKEETGPCFLIKHFIDFVTLRRDERNVQPVGEKGRSMLGTWSRIKAPAFVLMTMMSVLLKIRSEGPWDLITGRGPKVLRGRSFLIARSSHRQ